MITYTAVTIDAGTRVRPDHNTGKVELTKIPYANTLITGSEIFIATVALKNSSNVTYQIVGDKWLRTIYNGVLGWVAIIHMGLPICKNFTELLPPDPTPTPTFPESFVLENPDGTRAEYVFVKVFE